MSTELLFYAVAIGVGATVLTDIWAQLLKRAFDAQTLDWCLVGRWVGHMREGVFRHESIGRASQIQGECALGWVVHDGVGVGLAAALLAWVGTQWTSSPSLLPALGFGVLTVALPFFVMQPGMGAGVMASKTPNPGKARLRSLLTHAVFGAGLYLPAAILSRLIAWPLSDLRSALPC